MKITISKKQRDLDDQILCVLGIPVVNEDGTLADNVTDIGDSYEVEMPEWASEKQARKAMAEEARMSGLNLTTDDPKDQ